MSKWYEMSRDNHPQIISSRVRLARNLNKYPFPLRINENAMNLMISDVSNAIPKDGFVFADLKQLDLIEKSSMLERHIISPLLLKSEKPSAVVVRTDEALSIMLGEEDHLRIQSIFGGDNLENSWALANEIDNTLEKSLDFAYDDNFGYLTSCPTNTGTGMRASYMVHLPMLEKNGQLRNVIQMLGKFGLTIRGIYGEGSDVQGSIYQISNQLTLGKSEQDIIHVLQQVTNQVIEGENFYIQKSVEQRKILLQDVAYRVYGTLTNCRILTLQEAMSLLSELKLGFTLGILDVPKPKLSIYNIMMNIHPSTLQKIYGGRLTESEAVIKRADYVREQLKD